MIPPARVRSSAAALLLISAGVALGACAADPAGPTPPVSPGSSGSPRDVNLIAKDYAFAPDVLDLVPGETVTLHVINGGLEVHEAIIGDTGVQDAWEAAEAAVAGAPPGPTPVVSVPPEVAGLRIVVRSGERVDVVWTVPADASAGRPWIVGCHIPGHWEKGMQIPVRWAGRAEAETSAPKAASVVRSGRAGRGASTASSVGGSR